MPTSMPMSAVLLLGAFGALLLLFLTGNHHRGALCAAVVAGVLIAGLTGLGDGVASMVAPPAAPTPAAVTRAP